MSDEPDRLGFKSACGVMWTVVNDGVDGPRSLAEHEATCVKCREMFKHGQAVPNGGAK